MIRRILEQDTLAAALACLTQARLAGAHNYLLLDEHGHGYNVEATPGAQVVTELQQDPLIHTNHCLMPETRARERQREQASRASSEARLERAAELLSGDNITPADLQELTRDDSAICIAPTGPDEIATSGAAIMQPATREFWAVWGLPSENAYERFTLGARA